MSPRAAYLPRDSKPLSLVVPWILLSCLLLASVSWGEEETADGAAPTLQVTGVLARVLDVEATISFYTELLGFELVERQAEPAFAALKSTGVDLFLLPAKKPARLDYPNISQAHLNMQVQSLEETLATLRERQVTLLEKEPRQAAVGPHMPIEDPSGNILNILEFKYNQSPLDKPQIFNFGITLTDMKKARDFYCDRLGFTVFSEEYYPPVIPLNRSGSMAIVLHETATTVGTAAAPETAQVNLLMAVDDLAAATEDLRRRGVELLHSEPKSFPAGNLVAFRDPFGNVHQLFQRRRDPSPAP